MPVVVAPSPDHRRLCREGTRKLIWLNSNGGYSINILIKGKSDEVENVMPRLATTHILSEPRVR